MKKQLIKFSTNLTNVLVFHNLTKYNWLNLRAKLQPHTSPIDVTPEVNANKNLCFLLGSPRSGTTLSSILLDKCPEIFSPPELYLATYDNIQQRNKLLKKSIYKSFTLGLVQCLSRLTGKSLGRSMAIARQMEKQNLDVKTAYDYLLSQSPASVFLDKTPCYLTHVSQELFTKRFPQAKYIYVCRHPLSVIQSQKKWLDIISDKQFKKFGLREIEKFKDDKIGYVSMPLANPKSYREFESFKTQVYQDTNFDKFKTLEHWWRYENQRTLDFLENVPEENKLIFTFESLLQSPQHQLQRILDFLGVEGDVDAMIKAYEAQKAPSTIGGILKAFWNWEIGDPNQIFMSGKIDPTRAEGWKKKHALWQKLEEETRALARRMGYEDPVSPATLKEELPAQNASVSSAA